MKEYAKQLALYEVDYDVFASSYYPFWHGTLDNLASVLTSISETYGKKTLIAETSYAYTEKDTDFFHNTVGEGSDVARPYPFTVKGQADSVRDLTDTAVNQIKDCLGICYWEGAWISVGTKSYEDNKKLWEKYGSGWASRFAAVYDPEDAGKYWGGTAVDNQALFDEKGHPLPSLKVFSLIRK